MGARELAELTIYLVQRRSGYVEISFEWSRGLNIYRGEVAVGAAFGHSLNQVKVGAE